jgi:IS4 transposase
MNLSCQPKEITDYYRKRWDIEVFLDSKQELNLSHLVSNKNGIEVMVYDDDCLNATADL